MGFDVVDVPAPLPLAIEVPRGDQIGHDALGGPLGDVEKVGEIPNTNAWVTGDQEERVAVIGEQAEVRDGAQGLVAPRWWMPHTTATHITCFKFYGIFNQKYKTR